MILITWHEPIPKECDILNMMFAQGLRVLHIRKPGLSDAELCNYLQEINPDYHCRIMLHQGYGLLEKFGCKGLHFPERNKQLYWKYASLPFTKSWAVHSIKELYSVPDEVDYILLSPVFPSISKQGYRSNWPVGEPMRYLREVKSTRFRHIALGGIDCNTAPKALEMGFDGIAVMGAIWEPVIRGDDYQQTLKCLLQFESNWEKHQNSKQNHS